MQIFEFFVEYQIPIHEFMTRWLFIFSMNTRLFAMQFTTADSRRSAAGQRMIVAGSSSGDGSSRHSPRRSERGEESAHFGECHGGIGEYPAPFTKRSGKSRIVIMRQAVHVRLRNGAYHWARVALQHDPQSRANRSSNRSRLWLRAHPAICCRPPARRRL